MLKQTLIFAYRSFFKSLWLNGLNMAGLILGLSVFFLVSLFVYQEGSYEIDFSQRDRIYQIGTDFMGSGKMARASHNLALSLDQMPEIETYTAFSSYDKTKIFLEGNDYQERRVIDADSSFFKVFDFELLAGDISTIFDKPNQVIINEAVAKEIFGTTDVLGKELKVGTYLFNYEVAIIRGVSKSPTYKTQLDFDIIRSQGRSKGIDPKGWGNVGPYVYAVVSENIAKDQLQQKLDLLAKERVYPVFGQSEGTSYEQWRASDGYLGYFASSLDDLRYNTDMAYNMMPKADTNRTNTLTWVGLAALVISLINFVNISTAKASLRMKEVALKRLMGSSRLRLIFQFMLESFIAISLSSIVALGLVEVFINWQPATFSGFVEYSVLHSSQWVYGIICFILLFTMLSGLYPAIYLSSGNVITILKNGMSKGSFSIFNAALLRKFATVLQFSCSVGLIGAVITMFLQIDYLRNRDLGFESADVLVIKNIHDLGEKVDAFRQDLETLPAVITSSYANDLPAEGNDWNQPREVAIGEDKTLMVSHIGVEGSFFETLDLDFKMGTTFSNVNGPLLQKGMAAPPATREIVINEQMAKQLGLENPVGQKLEDQVITGVVEDFLFRDLVTATEPMILYRMPAQEISPFFYNPLFIELQALNQNNRATIEAAWEKHTDKRIDLVPMDVNYDRLMAIENTSFNAVLIFSVFALVVSCIGLFGLAVFAVDQRIKEFGIRKVLGATMQDIIRLFSWDFLKLVLLAFIIAMPVTLYVLNLWLDGFADRITIEYPIILATGLLATSIAIATIIFQSLKAGRLNPADTLRRE